MRLVQILTTDGNRRVAVVPEHGDNLQCLHTIESVRELALFAHRNGIAMEEAVHNFLGDQKEEYGRALDDGRVLLPIDHPDPAHVLLSGTGLDHLGSAQARDAMHAKLNAGDAELTDSMRMFKIGLEGGKPESGQIGSQPEWFYKGDGSWLVVPGHSLELPAFSLDGSEEPELVGIYVIGDNGEVLRVGFSIGNEYSDHVLEKQNYLYLAHSKLRTSSFGPELRLGPAPTDVRGTSRILRDGAEIWSGEFQTGESNMTYTIPNIEHHHFKYARFRRPGDVHCHYFGTATLSFAAGVHVEVGDVFEIEAAGFGVPLRNPVAQTASGRELTQVVAL